MYLCFGASVVLLLRSVSTSGSLWWTVLVGESNPISLSPPNDRSTVASVSASGIQVEVMESNSWEKFFKRATVQPDDPVLRSLPSAWNLV